MLHATTPFKIIHDENDYASSLKPGKTKGLKSSMKAPVGGKVSFENTPVAAKKAANTATGQRRALSSLSTSQVNARLNTPGHGLSKVGAKLSILGENAAEAQTEKKTSKKSHADSKVSFAVSADKGYVPSLEEMKCSRSVAPLDPYDEMLLKARTQMIDIEPYEEMYDKGVGASLEDDLQALVDHFQSKSSEPDW